MSHFQLPPFLVSWWPRWFEVDSFWTRLCLWSATTFLAFALGLGDLISFKSLLSWELDSFSLFLQTEGCWSEEGVALPPPPPLFRFQSLIICKYKKSWRILGMSCNTAKSAFSLLAQLVCELWLIHFLSTLELLWFFNQTHGFSSWWTQD